MKKTEFLHGRHCVYNLHVHLVFVIKYRRKVLTAAILGELRNIFSLVCVRFESKLLEFDGEADHVHLLVGYPPKVAISKLGKALWSPSYFACSCGGASISIIRQYIEQQNTPD